MARPLGSTLPLKLEFNGHFGTNYDLVKQVKSNLVNLILTKKGERLHQPNFGCDVWKFLFEPLTPETRQNAFLTLVRDVEVWMPFLEIVTFNLEFTNEEVDRQTIRMVVQFRLRFNPNIGDTIVLTF